MQRIQSTCDTCCAISLNFLNHASPTLLFPLYKWAYKPQARSKELPTAHFSDSFKFTERVPKLICSVFTRKFTPVKAGLHRSHQLQHLGQCNSHLNYCTQFHYRSMCNSLHRPRHKHSNLSRTEWLDLGCFGLLPFVHCRMNHLAGCSN